MITITKTSMNRAKREVEKAYAEAALMLDQVEKNQDNQRTQNAWVICLIYNLLVIDGLKMELDYPEELENISKEYSLDMSKCEYTGGVDVLRDSLALLLDFLQPGLSPERINKFNYSQPERMAQLISQAPHYPDWKLRYQTFMAGLFKTNVSFIKKKEKIKVAFFVPSSTYFSCESIYRKFEADPLYEPYLVLIAHYQDLEYKAKEESIKFFRDMCAYFAGRDFKYVIAYDPDTDTALSYDEIGAPDIIFHTYPYTERYFEEKLDFKNIPLTVLNVYIPYGIQSLNIEQRFFNYYTNRVCFKLYFETPMHKERAAEISFMGDSNIVVSGYVKMDASYSLTKDSPTSVWKNAGTPIYKMIYAPHHSLMGVKTSSGTFRYNAGFFYNLAKSTPQISWVIKPHPALRVRSVPWGVFSSVEEYDAYMQAWADLPNASVVQEGYYQDIFATSDAMIFDCISFMSEYLYYHKPSLFMTRSSNDFNDYGHLNLNALYTVDGKDTAGIANFLKEVVIGGNDYKKEEREAFFSKYLDYKTINGKLAADTIYDDINSYFVSDDGGANEI